MSSIDSDDDSFPLPPPPVASPKRSLKRLKKKVVTGFAAHTEGPELPSSLASSPPPVPRAFGFASDDSNGSFPLLDVFGEVGVVSPSLQEDTRKDLDLLASDSDQDDSDDNNDGEDSDDSDECVDEDDELAILTFLGKGRETESNYEGCTEEESLPTEASDPEAGKSSKKKRKSSELDEIHAASQRLLRETPNASFKPQISCAKPISSVLEKIRLRKLQLAQGFESRISSSIQVNQVTTTTSISNLIQVGQNTTATLEVQFFNENSNTLHDMAPVTDACIDQGNSTANQEEASVSSQIFKKEVGVPTRTNVRPDDFSSAAIVGSRNPFQTSGEHTQNETNESGLHSGQDCLQKDPLNLHLDTEDPEDCGSWDDEEGDKENVAPRCVPTHISRGAPVRALIDDEAEDEDVLNLDDDEEADDEEGLGDMIVDEDVHEGNVDVHKRTELHRKWLEQQDVATTDDILLRLKTGWRQRENRKRGLGFLDVDVEEQGIPLKQPKNRPEDIENDQPEEELLDEDSRPSAASKDEDSSAVDAKLFESLEDVDDVHESSDDEEREERIMRQRFLQDSEEHGQFLLPADDETSREVFELINRANSTTKNKKLKAGAVDLKLIGGGTSCSNSAFTSKGSFLRKKAASASSSAQKQGPSSIGSRSFIFGRDDSNSSHGLTDHRQRQTMGDKENLEPGSLSSSSSSSSASASGPMKMDAKQTAASRLGGLSLFEILRGQSKSSDPQPPMHHNKPSPISPMFSAFKFMKANGKQVPHAF